MGAQDVFQPFPAAGHPRRRAPERPHHTHEGREEGDAHQGPVGHATRAHTGCHDQTIEDKGGQVVAGGAGRALNTI